MIVSNNETYSTQNSQASNTSKVDNDENKSSTSFSDNLDEVQNKKKEEEKDKTLQEELETTQKLVDDILSLFKTGLTVDELEALEKLIEEIKKKIKEEAKNGSESSIDEIKKLVSDLENMIASIKKRITGEAIKESKKEGEEVKGSDTLTGELASLNERLETSIQDVKDLMKGSEKKGYKSSNTQEELELLNNLKQFKKLA